MNLTEISIRRPVFAWMIMAALVLFGGIALTRTGISQFPDVDFPTITVSVTWEGASPEVMETDVVDILEDALMQVEGVKQLRSSTRQGAASVTVELELERDVDTALQDAQTKVAQAQRRLPRDIDPPIVSKTNPEDQPILWVGLSGTRSPQELADYARYVLKDRFQTIPGVGEVTLGGSLSRAVRIWIDGRRLDTYGLTIGDVTTALGREHVEMPAGRIETGRREVNVRVEGEALDLAALRNLVVAGTESAPIRLADVALVEDGFEDIRRLGRVMGEPAQGLGIRKQRGANAVAVAGEVKAMVERMKADLPEGMQLGINFDSTRFIEAAVHEIELELVLAVLLTALVCWFFLGSLSSTLNVVLAIPMSLLGTLAVIHFLGFTLNTFTLLALSLSVGIVVDDAIMVLENIHRHGEMGKGKVRAAREGTFEITFAALAATVAIVAIFLPVVFMKGVIGRFFLQFGITLSLAVLFSYLEAITLTPARCSQFLAIGGERTRIGRIADRMFGALARRYERLLDRALARRRTVLVGALLLFLASLAVIPTLRREMVPSQDQGNVMIRLQTPVGSSIWETEKIFTRAEEFLRGRPEVKRTFGAIGGFGGGEVNTAILFLTLVDPSERMPQSAFMDLARKELNSYPGARAVLVDLSQSGFSASRGFPVEVSVRGPDWDTLGKGAEEILESWKDSDLLTDVDTNYQVGMPELRILPDRARAADLGVSMETLAETVNALVGGVRVGKFKEGGRRIDVRVRLVAPQRLRAEDLDRIRVRAGSGELIPLGELVTMKEEPTLQTVTREDRQRAVSLYANVAAGKSQADALDEALRLAREKLPPGYTAVLAGSSASFRESMGGLLFALVMGIAVAFMVLASQFNSFLHPVTILTILPLSVTGALLALRLTGQSLNIFSMIGLLLLMGIVKKNSIILVDYANQAAASGRSALEAMRVAGPMRLRPILMTSVATLVAALPPALSLGPGAEIRMPMAVAVIGGVVVSTALSLVVVPCFYVAVARFHRSPPPDGEDRREEGDRAEGALGDSSVRTGRAT